MSWEPEPNTFYEPRPAVAPFFVVYEYDEQYYPQLNEDGAIENFDSREFAEKRAREEAENSNYPHFVVGCVSISSVPQPTPLKASTRALV